MRLTDASAGWSAALAPVAAVSVRAAVGDAVVVLRADVGRLETADEKGVRRVGVGLDDARPDRLDPDELRGVVAGVADVGVEPFRREERDEAEREADDDPDRAGEPEAPRGTRDQARRELPSPPLRAALRAAGTGPGTVGAGKLGRRRRDGGRGHAAPGVDDTVEILGEERAERVDVRMLEVAEPPGLPHDRGLEDAPDEAAVAETVRAGRGGEDLAEAGDRCVGRREVGRLPRCGGRSRRGRRRCSRRRSA